MTARVRAFVGLGSNLGDRRATLEAALGRLASLEGSALAAVSAAYENPPVGGPPQPDYWNAVAELGTTLPPRVLIERLHAIEAAFGRVRVERDGPRTLDLDLLAFGESTSSDPDLVLPHPRSLDRAFTLEPWVEIAPEYLVAGTGRTVLELAARLRGSEPAAFACLHRAAILVPARDAARAPRAPEVLEDRESLRRFRESAGLGSVGLLPTLGALHEGHASLARRAVAENDVAIASIFVNPLQFGPNEDFTRYPRTFDADLALLARERVAAVYAPTREDLYPAGFSTTVDVAGVTERFEGAIRPTHFRGVATVVAKLLARVRPDRTYFGRKDAQQVALVRRLAADLDLPGEIVVAPTIEDLDGLALSSRNRYLTPDQRARALALPRALAAARDAAAAGTSASAALVDVARRALAASDLVPDYLDVVDPSSFASVASVAARVALLVAAVRVGATRLLDNEWLVAPAAVPAVA